MKTSEKESLKVHWKEVVEKGRYHKFLMPQFRFSIMNINAICIDIKIML